MILDVELFGGPCDGGRVILALPHEQIWVDPADFGMLSGPMIPYLLEWKNSMPVFYVFAGHEPTAHEG